MTTASSMYEHSIENMQFSVRTVKSPSDLQKVAELRQKAYARHITEFAKRLAVLEHEVKLDVEPLIT